MAYAPNIGAAKHSLGPQAHLNMTLVAVHGRCWAMADDPGLPGRWGWYIIWSNSVALTEETRYQSTG